MRPVFKTQEAAINQLYETEDTIKNFLDEVKGDDLQRYPNVEQHLQGLITSIEKSDSALIALENLNVKELPNLTSLIETINAAIGVIKKNKGKENTGTLVAALAALNEFQASIGEIKREGPIEDKRLRVQPTDTDIMR